MQEQPELTPQTYVRCTVISIWENLPKVVLAGLVFSLFCGPAFALTALGLFGPAVIVAALTIAPAWSALLYLEGELIQESGAGFGDTLRAVPGYAGDSIRLAILLCPFLLGIFWLLPILSQPTVSPLFWATLTLCIICAVALITFYLYAFPLLVQYDLGALTALRNGAILASRYAANSVGLLSMGVLCALAIRSFSLALLFFLPAMFGMFVVNNC